MITWWIILGIAALVVLWVIGAFNRLVTLRNRTDESWSDIDVQLKRRYDLIPNLVETVKGYATHEREAFENVTRARAAAISAQGPHAKGEADNLLTGALKSLFAIAEAYPDLKANQNFLRLQDELADTENKIQAARRFYNANVRDFNTAQQTFPTNLLASGFGFKPREFFELEQEAAREPVAVKF
ncbi:MAG: LemA family protein [Candidatus Kerfeldbacteria bacterium]|nr:LemA family protein [Candidatus Kerfeldbacteria bacterium]